LWILGFLASLLAGSGSSINVPSLPINLQPGLPALQGSPFLNRLLEGDTQLVTALIAALCVLAVLVIVLAVVSLIAQGGLIAGVGQVEEQGSMSLGQAWSAAARRFWGLLGLRILLALPVLGLAVLAVVLLGGSLLPAAIAAARGEESPDLGSVGASLFLLLCSGCVLLCAFALYAVLSSALQTFGERAMLLEGMGVISGLRRGWEVLRSSLFNVILLALVLLVLNALISLVTGLIFGVIALPATIAGLITSFAEEGPQPVTLVLIALAFSLVALIAALVSALVTTFGSAIWTVAYRQIANAQRGSQQLAVLPSA
jgi:hypothetical protein